VRAGEVGDVDGGEGGARSRFGPCHGGLGIDEEYI
jgi:hypothetical protein